MNKEQLKKEVSGLVKEIIGKYPMEAGFQKNLNAMSEELKERQRVIQELTSSLEGLLDILRLHIKYLLFDLEATRRENALLIQKLEDNESN